MTWQEVLDSNYKTVTVQSYGYEERSFIGRHFEPFKTKRSFKFRIDRNFKMLDHNWLFLEDPEEELFFEEKDGEIILDDPDLWARP